MPGNPTPIFAKVGKINFAQTATAVTGADMTNAALIFTADATNGSIVKEVRVKYLPATSTAATAFRVFVNNGSAIGTTTNNTLITEITIAAITGTNSSATTDYVVPMPGGGLVLPPGYRLYGAIGSYSTGTFMITAIGGDY